MIAETEVQHKIKKDLYAENIYEIEAVEIAKREGRIIETVL